MKKAITSFCVCALLAPIAVSAQQSEPSTTNRGAINRPSSDVPAGRRDTTTTTDNRQARQMEMNREHRSDVKEETGDKLNSLLRGELSAVETYQQALRKVGNDPRGAQLNSILKDHQTAVEKIRSEVQKTGETPSTDSGAWGSWAKTVEGTAKLFGDASALRALKQGEQHGLDEYQQALESDDVAQNIKEMIKSDFIPKQKQHIAELDKLIKKA